MPSSKPLRWTDLRSLAVGVWGVGVEGRASLAKLRQLGTAPKVIVDDDAGAPDVLATSRGGLDALRSCDVVVKAPGISRYRADVASLQSAGVHVVGGLGLWLEEVGPERVVGITGTKGKSTTVAIAGHVAGRMGCDAAIGGNIGKVPWNPDHGDGEPELWIIEVSSYQATDLWSSPAVVGVTSLHPDHLDWHGNVDNYVRDKLSLCGRPGGRIVLANAHDPWLLRYRDLLTPGPRWIEDDSGPDWLQSSRLRGRHNVRNALLAAACLEEMGVAGAGDVEQLQLALSDYQPLPHRLETVATVDGIEFVDDSLSTNVLPTIVAAEVFDGRPLALLVGGKDRNIDYLPLAEFVRNRAAPTQVFTLPENGLRIHQAMVDAGVESMACRDIDHAVAEAASSLAGDGVVLLSPAAASYGLYRNYQERAAAFTDAIERLKTGRRGRNRRP